MGVTPVVVEDGLSGREVVQGLFCTASEKKLPVGTRMHMVTPWDGGDVTLCPWGQAKGFKGLPYIS